jgi:CubicO group peptidase (beta-lactamase class C family)
VIVPNAETSVEGRPEEVGVSSEKLARALSLLDGWVEQGRAPGVAAVVVRRDVVIARRFRGRADWNGEDRPVTPGTIFALPAVTKAVTATAFMLLVEAGEVLLDDPVVQFVPEFGKLGKEQVRVRHLLSHTSGLPDMLPNNEALRKAHSNVHAFVRATYRQELAFAPGTRSAYSSAGYLMLAEIAERVAKQPFAEYVGQRVLNPLGTETLGFRPAVELYPRISRLRLAEGRAQPNWDNNSPYWRQLGAPWGGLFGTADDVARFGQGFLAALRGESGAVLGPAAARLMVQSHTRGIPSESGAPEAWGFGWAFPAGQRSHWLGDLASPEAFGDAGAYGTMLWIDPPRQLVCVIVSSQLTNFSAESRRYACFSNALQAAVTG